ncbi:NYN domain-containing protein [Pseudogemmobacter humi]|uniref:NYN domain protein n=1 Tax=Pseudogemmobacter humi TaxID=2483812 RepID=A0A3P5WP86_9RHOB|nr:NYN domain-containing protein [Pseudogemmobacter humi]VDC23578.1 NYN domain protein [Pseudogemmobacter humi]
MDLSPTAALSAPLTALVDTPLALLVDGENIPKTFAPDLLPVARLCGDARIRRVYGGLQHISGWEDHGFRLCPTRPGKNSADMLLCVEAMLLALREEFPTIAIVTGDRDFSYLAEQLREIGIRVIGIGDGRTPASFRNACSCFYQFDEVKAGKAATGKTRTTPPAPAPKPLSAASAPSELERLIPELERILRSSDMPGGWTASHWLRKQLAQSSPESALGKLSHRDFAQALRECGRFEVLQHNKTALLLRPLQPDLSARSASPRAP